MLRYRIAYCSQGAMELTNSSGHEVQWELIRRLLIGQACRLPAVASRRRGALLAVEII